MNQIDKGMPENSLVHTDKGLVRIKDIKVGDKVLTSNGYDKVIKTFIRREQDIVTIKTHDGEFKATSEQYIAVLTTPKKYTWKMIKDLKYGDIIISTRTAINGIQTKLPDSVKVNVPVLNERFAWKVGFLQSKKPYEIYEKHNYISFKFDKLEYEKLEKIKQMLYQMIKNDDDTFSIKVEEYEDFYILYVKSPELFDYITKYIIPNYVPYYIFNGTYDVRTAYIAGIIDGCNIVDKNNDYINIAKFKDVKIVEELQKICYSCGFETIVKSNDDNHYLCVVTNYSISNLLEMSFLNKKDIINKYYNKIKNGVNSYPIHMIKNDSKYNIHKFESPYKKNIDVNVFEKHFEEFNYCPVKVYGFTYDIEYTDTYDIEVNNKHEYYCDGVLIRDSKQIK